ncbi:MAG: hypothetical protein ACRETL_09930, partial [Gammaproteobacteria bacterium]
ERDGEDWRIWFNPWYVAEIAFHCRSIFLDGAEVRVPDGGCRIRFRRLELSNKRLLPTGRRRFGRRRC